MLVSSDIKRILAGLSLTLMVFCNTDLFADTEVVPQPKPSPCSALYPGYYFTGPHYQYKPVLFSNMPLEQFIGYVIMDSIITYARDSFPTAKAQENFIKGLTRNGDTLNYALKYLYRMADYNPFLYYNFLTSYQAGKQQPMTLLPKLLDQVRKEYGIATQQLMKAEYILHLRVNEVERFAYESSPPWTGPNGKVYTDSTKLIYVYSQVLDTIKGQVLPNMSSAITVFDMDSSETKVRRYIPSYIPATTNFVYYYNPSWSVGYGGTSRRLNGGEEPGKEFIVFAYSMGACINSSTRNQYYEIRPTTLGLWGGIFRIIDGKVYDSKNEFGWGTHIPLATFKQNLQSLLDSIRNYGE